MIPVELIRKKREGHELTAEELSSFIGGYVDGDIPDYQMAAWLMAVYFNGMSLDEIIEFTRVMLHSGTIIDLSSVPGIKVDKHSTGGVGDKVSIILAPLVAACGVPVPMISGRGLGHTGGTLDKLESIPGFRTDLDIEAYIRVIRTAGIVMIGQTDTIVPADKKMYALRDVTATVDCIPLMAGSIMSKKLAEGIDALVLDVKTGTGAFMREIPRAIELARTLIDIGEGFGKRTVGYITDMNQPLGRTVGNWLEIEECIRCLRGEEVSDLMQVTYRLAGTMLYLGTKASSIDEGEEIARGAIADGNAYNKFVELVELQGGDTKVIEHPESYPAAKHTGDVPATADGYISAIDCREIGIAGIEIGAGRKKINDTINYKAGIRIHKKVGDKVKKNESLAAVYSDEIGLMEGAVQRVRNAYGIQAEPAQLPVLIHGRIDKDGYTPLGTSASSSIVK
jgi:pyrimidine-nucleoside phosphorylase